MNTNQIALGRERKQLFLFSGLLFALVLVVSAAAWQIGPATNGLPSPPWEESIPTGGACGFVAAVFLCSPAFLFMAFLKHLRSPHYFAAVCIAAFAGAGILGYLCYCLDANSVQWRPPSQILARAAHRAYLGFLLGLIAGSCLAPLGLWFFPGSKWVPQDNSLHHHGVSGPIDGNGGY